MTLFLSLLWFVAVIWLISRAFRQRNVLPRLTVRPLPDDTPAPRIAVVIPARNEAANIGPCLVSLLRQAYPAARWWVTVVDDDSSDDTAAIVAGVARRDPRVSLMRSPPLPPGWNGKANALAAGAATASEADWLCFLDADMRTRPLLLASAVGAAMEGIDCLSLAPRHRLGSFAERLMIPCGLYLLSFLQDLSQVQAPDSDEVVATGQFMLVRRAAYDSAGGYAAVADDFYEDVALARLLKRRGHRVLLQDGSKLLSTRMYSGWPTLWEGFAKNLTHMLGGPAATLATAVVTFVMAWTAVALPMLDTLRCVQGSHDACLALAPALAGSAAIFGLHLAGAAYFQIPLWYGLLFPLGYSVGGVLALDSLRWRLTGRVRWKGRTYP